MRNLERDAEICRLYTEGETLQWCADQFKISRERIRQILIAAKVYRPTRDVGDRQAYLGVELRASVKEALQKKAKEDGVSMSRFVSDLVEGEIGGAHEDDGRGSDQGATGV